MTDICTCGHFKLNHWRIRKDNNGTSKRKDYIRGACGMPGCKCVKYKKGKQKLLRTSEPLSFWNT